MAGIVYILGAGASYGDALSNLDDSRQRVSRAIVQPPLIDGFFRKDVWDAIGYQQAEGDFRGAFSFIRYLKQIPEAVAAGEGKWRELNLEELFTSIEVEREFRGPESDIGARLTIHRNQLVRYIARMLAFSTQGLFGKYVRLLVASIEEEEDSILSFNYDLLVDQEILLTKGKLYERFTDALFEQLPGVDARLMYGPSMGLLLKMHGSLNWLQCTNAKCPGHSRIDFEYKTQEFLDLALGIQANDEACHRCGSERITLLIPPLLRKPIVDNWIFRSIWGLARHRLETAEAVVVIGFSVPPTDFYASWLLQTTVGVKEKVPIFVVNPANSKENAQHDLFAKRMGGIFPHGYNSHFASFSEIEHVILEARKAAGKLPS